MHDNVSSGSTTTYIVGLERTQRAEITVDVAGPPSPEGRAEAERIARQRLGAREAFAWAAVGEPIVFAAEPVAEDAVVR